MKSIDEIIQKIKAQASRYDDDYMVANLELVNKLCEICRDSNDVWYLDKIVQTFCEILKVQQDIIEELKCELDNAERAAQASMQTEQETQPLFKLPSNGVFETSLQVKEAFLGYLQGIKNSHGKGLSPTTVFDYSSRINMLWVHFYKEWESGKLEGKLQVCKEHIIPAETYLNVYNNIETLEMFLKLKEWEIEDRARRGNPFTAEELKESPLNNGKNLRNSYASLKKLKEFKKVVSDLASAESK